MAQYTSLDAVPVLEEIQGLKPKRPMDLADRLENLSIGLGKGAEAQMEGIKQLVTSPIDAFSALYEMGKYAVQNPREAASGVLDYVKQGTTGGPLAMGQFIGENIGPGMFRRSPVMKELDVYHGTPHRFEPEEGFPLGRFRSEKIGTGEGAQAFGYGLYLAENPKVARGYKNPNAHSAFLGRRSINIGGKSYFGRQELTSARDAAKDPVERAMYDILARAQEKGIDGPVKLARAVKEKPVEWGSWDFGQETIDAAMKRIRKEATFSSQQGHFYTVDLPDKMIDRMLDWDRPLSEQKAALDAFRKAGIAQYDSFDSYLRANKIDFDALSPDEKWKVGSRYQDESGLANLKVDIAYKQLAKKLGSDQAASEYLRNSGIPGIRFLDGQSRKAGEGTRNFVVFPGEEQNLRILERQ